MREFNPQPIPPPPLPEGLHERLIASAPLDVEIGAGQGLHAVRYGQAHPERTLLAIERTHTKFARFLSRWRNHPELRDRVIPLHADGVAIVAHYLRASQLERVFLLYPNPSPKAKHAHRRWHNTPFMGHLHGKLRAGGEIVLATNLKWYADEAKAVMIAQWKFTLSQEREFRGPDAVANARTHFEKKYLERGETCYEMVFKKE